jgi:chemotaxis signal transduction protein
MTEASTQLYVLARIADVRRLIDLHLVQEILPAMRLHVPQGSGGKCLGVANIRGEILPVFRVDEEHGREMSTAQLIVVLSHAASRVGVLVDDVIDVVEVDPKCVTRHGSGTGRELRTVNLSGIAVTVFELEEALHAA